MILIEDESQFDALQHHLITEIIESIRNGLRSAGINDEDTIYQATGDLAFSVAAIIDGSQLMELNGVEVIPVLTFAKERDGNELIGSKAGGSWMHEYVFGVVEDVFESVDEGDDS